MPLGELRLVRAQNPREVREYRRLPTERLVHQLVPRRARKPLFTAKHVCDLHEVIVDDASQVIGRESVRLQDHEIVERIVLERHIAPQRISRYGLTIQWRLEPHNRGDSAAFRLGPLVGRQGATVPVVARRLFLRLLFLAHPVQPLPRAVAAVRPVARDETFGVLLKYLDAFRLHVRSVRAAYVRAFVPIEAEPPQRLHLNFNALLHESRTVGVLDPQDELAAFVLGQQPIEQRRADIP